MKLRQRLKQGDILRIGFVGDRDRSSGSGFIFCGRVDSKTKAYISKKSAEERKRLKAEFKRCEALAKTKKKYVEEKEYYRARLEAWVPWLDREILQDYPSLMNSEVSIVLCEGDERGRFWLISEFYRSQCGKADYKAFKVSKRQEDIYCKKYNMPCLEAIEMGKCKDGGSDERRDDE